MPINTVASEKESNIPDRVSDVVEQTKNKITQFGTTASDKFDQNRVAAASGLDNAAESLHQRADELPGGDKVADMAHSTADKLSATADYVRENDISAMMADLESLVKKNPGPALLVAVGAGFLLARAFSGDSRG